MAGIKGKNTPLILSSLSPELIAERLLKSAGWPEAIQIQEFAGGRNNRVFRVETQRGSVCSNYIFGILPIPETASGTNMGFWRLVAGLASTPCLSPWRKILKVVRLFMSL